MTKPDLGMLLPLRHFIAMTAYAMAGDKGKFLSAGMNAYISNFVDMSRLRAVIDRVGAKLAEAIS